MEQVFGMLGVSAKIVPNSISNFMLADVPGVWCWAAVTAAVRNKYEGLALQPCDIVELALNIAGSMKCCNLPPDPICNATRNIEVALGNHLGKVQGQVEFKDLDTEVGHQRPVVLRVNNGASHVVVVSQTSGTPGSGAEQVKILNPAPPPAFEGWRLFADLVKGDHVLGAWINTIFTKG